MRILVAVAAETKALVEVKDKLGAVLDSFDVVWRTPNDDEAVSIQRSSYAFYKGMESVRGGTGDIDAMWEKIEAARESVKQLIRDYLIKVDDPDFEPSDVDRMLSHNIYSSALMSSLMSVVTGDVALGNLKKPPSSGKTDDSQAVPAKSAKGSKKKKPQSLAASSD